MLASFRKNYKNALIRYEILKIIFGKFGFNLTQTKILGRERGNMALAFQLTVDLPTTLQIFLKS